MAASGNTHLTTSNLSLDNNLTVTGTSTLTGAVSLTTALTVGTTLTVTGAATLSSTLGVTGVITANAANVISHANTGLKVLDTGGDHTVSIVPAGDEAANRTLSIPALGGNDTLVTLATTQTITGVKTMSGANVITHAPTGLKIQDSNASHVVTIAPGDESADRTLSIPVLGGADTVMTLGTAQSVTGIKTFAAGTALQTAGTGSGTFSPAGYLSVQTTAVATAADTNETDGLSYTLPANSLSANGKGVKVVVWGTCAANGNNKTVQLYFGGTSKYTTGAVAANAKNWKFEMTVIRTGSNAQDIFIDGHFNGAVVNASNIVTETKTDSSTIVIKNTMTNGTASASDITTEGMLVQFIQ